MTLALAKEIIEKKSCSALVIYDIEKELDEEACTGHILIGRAFSTRSPASAFSKVHTTTIHSHHSSQTQLTMALLVDKLRPKTLDALTYHPELSDRLRSLVRKLSLARLAAANLW
jgi:hypothetical protein